MGRCGLLRWTPSSAHSNPEDAVGYVEHRAGLAEEGQVEVVRPRVEDVPVEPLVGILAVEVDGAANWDLPIGP